MERRAVFTPAPIVRLEEAEEFPTSLIWNPPDATASQLAENRKQILRRRLARSRFTPQLLSRRRISSPRMTQKHDQQLSTFPCSRRRFHQVTHFETRHPARRCSRRSGQKDAACLSNEKRPPGEQLGPPLQQLLVMWLFWTRIT